jgi:hypothetical protein
VNGLILARTAGTQTQASSNLNRRGVNAVLTSDQTALAGLGVVILVQIATSIWWAATTSAKVKELDKKAQEHGGIRDIVIEMRSEMRQFSRSISDLAEGLKELSKPRRRNSTEG